MDRNADTEEASSIALADDDGSLTDKVCCLFLSSLLTGPGNTLFAQLVAPSASFLLDMM